MLTYDDALNMNYYKKTSFSGWMGGMRFLLKKDQIPLPEDAPEGTEPEPPFFHAWVWAGPYIFALTPEEKKKDQTFPFNDDGRRAAVDWINAQYDDASNEWPDAKMDTRNM